MPHLIHSTIREVLLTAIRSPQPYSQDLQQGPVLNAAKEKVPGNTSEQAILTEWHDLFRTGLLAWGLNLCNPNPPFFHVTNRGQVALQRLSRDPANPAGYTRHLESMAVLDAVSRSYLLEAIDCYVDGLFKAAAVMVGCSAESIILTLRSTTTEKLQQLGRKPPKGINDWKIRTVSDALYNFFKSNKASFDRELWEPFEAYWPAFAQQIRANRNEANHPSSIEPVTADMVHASLLVFPELARLTTSLSKWVVNSLT